METVGLFEAKTHLSALLDEVADGAEIEITRRGEAVARLVPARSAVPACLSDTRRGSAPTRASTWAAPCLSGAPARQIWPTSGWRWTCRRVTS